MKRLLIIVMSLILSLSSQAQYIRFNPYHIWGSTAIGKGSDTPPDGGSLLDIGVSGSKKAVLFRPMQKDSVPSPKPGMFGYDSIAKRMTFYNGSQWSYVLGSLSPFTPARILFLRDFGAIPDDTLCDQWQIQLALDSASALGGRVKIVGEAGEYLLKDTIQKFKNGRSCNAQLVIAHNDRVQDNSEGFIYITIEGPSMPSDIEGYITSSLGAPDPLELAKHTLTFRSTINNDGSLYPSILGAAQGGFVTGAGVHINHLSVNFKNMAFIINYDGANGGVQLCGPDLDKTIGQYSENIRITPDTPGAYATVRDYELFAFRGINSWGNTNTLKNSLFSGFKYGAVMGAHGIVEKFMPFNCDYGLVLQQNEQGVVLVDYMPIACAWNIATGLIDGGICRLTGYYHSEKMSTGVGANLGDLYDPGNLVHGKIEFSNFRNLGGWERTFIRNGGRNLVVEVCDSSRVYMYGNGTYGGIHTDSLNHVITHGGLTVSHVSSATVTRPHTIGLLAGYTGSARTDGLLVTNAAAGTGQNINTGTLNAGFASGATGSTIGYNVGVRGASSGSTTWNYGVQGLATAPVGNNIGGFFWAGNNAGTMVGAMAVLGTPSTMPTIVESAAFIADPLTSGKTALLVQVNGVRKFTVDNVGNVMIGSGTASGNPLDIFASSNSSIGLRIQNTSNGTAARAGLDLVNDQTDVFRMSLASSGFTTAGIISARDAVISYGGGGSTGGLVLNALNLVKFGTVNIERMRLDLDGDLGIGTTPTTSAILDVSSTSKGFAPPRMTNAQKGAISSPIAGLEVYCTDCTATDGSTGVKQTYNGSTWKNHW